MPISPNDLVRVLIEVVGEANRQYERKQDRNQSFSCVIGIVAGATIGGLVSGVAGLFIGGAFGFLVAFINILYETHKSEKPQDACNILKALKDEKRHQLLQHFQSNILSIQLDSCSVHHLREELVCSGLAKERTLKILETYFDRILGMDAKKFTAFQ